MRGQADDQPPLFHSFNVEDRIRADHPLRDVKRRVDRLLAGMSPLFAGAYSSIGRPSVPPERLLKALLLRALYSIRSERQLCEQIDVNLMFRWFLDLQPSEDAFDATTFTHNRQRLDNHGLTRAFFDAVVAEALTAGLCSEHFSVDGTLIQAWASHKSFVRKDRPHDDDNSDAGNFKGQMRSNDTHTSTTDTDARLYRKGKTASELRFMGHTLTDNRHGLVVNAVVTHADGYAEREAAKAMVNDARQALPDHEPVTLTLGADKGYDAREFIEALQEMNVLPHVAQNKSGRQSAVPEAIAGSEGYAVSQRKRKLIEQGFGWAKTVGHMRQVLVRGLKKVDQVFVLTMAGYNLTRLRTLGQLRLQGRM